MILRPAVLIALSFSLLSLAALSAEDAPPAAEPDPDLPQPFDANAFLPMLQHSPFSRVVDYKDSLLLTGVAYLEGKPMATLLDKNTKKRYVVSEEPNAQGWRLTSANVSNALQGTEVQMEVAGEVVTFHYSESQINPKGKAGAGVAASPGGSVNAAALLPKDDQDYMRKGMSKEARDKYTSLMEKLQSKMAKMSDADRAAYAQKYFNKAKASDQAAQNGGAPPSKGAPTSAAPVSKKSKR